MDWRHEGACVGEDAELFFPISVGEAAHSQGEQARRICLRCTVREQCLDWALRTGQDSGIWGGTTEHERRLLRRWLPGRSRPV